MSARFKQTPSQTVGPYFELGLTSSQYQSASKISHEILGEGKAIKISGHVYDGNGDKINDALIEIWQADCNGRFDNESFYGFARCGTGSAKGSAKGSAERSAEAGGFQFNTIKPGSAGPGQAPYISVTVFMRGLMLHAYTRLYFSDELVANQQDLVLQQLPEARLHTLIANAVANTDNGHYHFDIRMQGDQETIFFDI